MFLYIHFGNNVGIETFTKNHEKTCMKCKQEKEHVQELLCSSCTSSQKKYLFHHYKKIKDDDLKNIKRIIISPESLHRLKEFTVPDLFFIDETSSIDINFQTTVLMRNSLTSCDCFTVYENYMKNSTKVFLLDAWPNNRMMEQVKMFRVGKRFSHVYINTEYRPDGFQDRKLYIFPDMKKDKDNKYNNVIFSHIKDRLRKGENIFICCNVRSTLNLVYKYISDLKIIQENDILKLTSIDRKEIVDVNRDWVKRVVITTTTVIFIFLTLY